MFLIHEKSMLNFIIHTIAKSGCDSCQRLSIKSTDDVERTLFLVIQFRIEIKEKSNSNTIIQTNVLHIYD